jgi:uncharacterized membrane protein YGL010W
MNPKLEALFVEYADAHRHPMNRLTHKVAIPLIVFHIVAMLDWVTLPLQVAGVTPTLGHLAFVVAIGWYAAMHLRLGLIMAALFALCFPLGRALDDQRWVVVAVALVGWLVQLAGHVVWEKRSPAFLRNLLQALVGPLFFVALLTGDWKNAPASAETA